MSRWMYKMDGIDFVEYLPKELSEEILSYLSAQDLSKASMCSTAWRNATNQDPLWLHHCLVLGWIKFGLHMDLIKEKSMRPPHTSNISGTSPVFHDPEPEDSTLTPMTRWKSIFVRAHHLKMNWERGRYTVARVMRGHKEKVTCIDSNGSLLVTGSADKTMRIWDVLTGKCLHKLDVHSDVINCVTIKKSTIVTGCSDCTVRVFDASTGHQKLSFVSNGSIDKLAFNGDIIVTASSDKTVKVWLLSASKLQHILRGHTDEIECLSLYGHMALTGSWDSTLILWDVVKGKMLCHLQGHREVVTCCQFDEKQIISGSGDATVRIWGTTDGHPIKELLGHSGEVYCLMYNKEVIASGSSDSTVRVWSIDGIIRFVLREHLGIVRCLYIDNDKLISGGDRKKIVIWDWKKGKQLNVVHRHPTLLHLMWINETKLITASPESPGSVTVLSYW